MLAVAAGALLALPAVADQALATAKNCMACHAIDRKLVGPAYKDVAKKYAADKGAADALAAKIQKGGGNYRADGVDFTLFDVRCGEVWLNRENVEDIAHKLEVQPVPIVGRGPLPEAIELTKAGIFSAWGDFSSEGLVMRPAVEMLDRRGHRIITKVKTKDFANV